jgi:hypothetical protein
MSLRKNPKVAETGYLGDFIFGLKFFCDQCQLLEKLEVNDLPPVPDGNQDELIIAECPQKLAKKLVFRGLCYEEGSKRGVHFQAWHKHDENGRYQ